MSSQSSPNTAQSNAGNGIFSVSIAHANQWAQNLVAAFLGPLTASLQEIMQKARQAQVQFTKAEANSEKQAAQATKAAGLTEMADGIVSGVSGLGFGAATAFAGAEEAKASVDYMKQSKNFEQRAEDLDAQEKTFETGSANTQSMEKLQERRENEPKSREDVKRKRNKLQEERKLFDQKRQDARAESERKTRKYDMLNTATKNISQAVTSPIKAKEEADSSLNKAYSTIAQTGEKVLDGLYSNVEGTVQAEQTAAGGVYGSSRTAAGA